MNKLREMNHQSGGEKIYDYLCHKIYMMHHRDAPRLGWLIRLDKGRSAAIRNVMRSRLGQLNQVELPRGQQPGRVTVPTSRAARTLTVMSLALLEIILPGTVMSLKLCIRANELPSVRVFWNSHTQEYG